MGPCPADQLPDPLAIRRAAELLRHAQYIAVLTGAGASAESGIATFRDALTGQWTKFDPQQLASPIGFQRDPGLVWRWYMERLYWAHEMEPNAAHLALATLETLLPEFTLVTQNVDNLHEQAGSTRVLHLHGSIARFRCNRCSRAHALSDADRQAELPPRCPVCDGPIRPDVVWFGEMLPEDVVRAAWQAAESADVALVVGTSGVVYPAAQLPYVASDAGAFVIDVNPEPSAISAMAHVHLQGPSGEIGPKLLAAVRRRVEQA
ncbi:MAG: SIR2 family NAD-dependent protein deacylase [Anaerolineae bacterium]